MAKKKSLILKEEERRLNDWMFREEAPTHFKGGNFPAYSSAPYIELTFPSGKKILINKNELERYASLLKKMKEAENHRKV